MRPCEVVWLAGAWTDMMSGANRWITQGGDRVAKGKSMQKEKKKPKQKKK